MKKILQLAFALVFFSLGFSQELKPIAKKIKDAQTSNRTFVKYDLFTKDNSAQKAATYEKAAAGITVMKLNKTEVERIAADKPEALEMNFPFEGKTITVELVKNNFFTQDFKVNTDKGYVSYTPGVYYYGTVKGDATSLVAMSFFKDEVIGVTSISDVGNIVIGKTQDGENYVSYNDRKLTASNPFTCGVDDLLENQKMDIPTYDPKTMTAKKTDNCVRIYYEAGFGPYTQNGSSTATTVNWVSAMHNNISTLYFNDGITVALSEVFVWTTLDPFGGDAGTILAQFRASRPVFNGDVAQLIRNPATTSVAYLNSLCTPNKYSYSGVNFQYSNIPVYSWNIEAMTHEIGHNLGSPHTHACRWNGNNTAIDGCGPAAGYGEGCEAALPSGGGTIMSYCHLVNGVGIDFTKGFGPQPGALIRNTINAAVCLGSDCISSCNSTVSGLTVNSVGQTTVSATIIDDTGSGWKYQVAKTDGTIVFSGVVANKILNITNLESGTYYVISAGSSCSGPQAFAASQLILTEANWCSGTAFTDPGGASANYYDSQVIVKTFYPAVSTDKLKLTFTAFDLESGGDFLNIYDGISTGAPRFPGGTQVTGTTIPGPFQATNAAGAITVRFISNGTVTRAGWNSSFDCLTLGTSENSIKNSVEISATGTKGIFTITSKDKINSYQVFDASGKMIKMMDKLTGATQKLDLATYPVGTYLINLVTENGAITKKVLR